MTRLVRDWERAAEGYGYSPPRVAPLFMVDQMGEFVGSFGEVAAGSPYDVGGGIDLDDSRPSRQYSDLTRRVAYLERDLTDVRRQTKTLRARNRELSDLIHRLTSVLTELVNEDGSDGAYAEFKQLSKTWRKETAGYSLTTPEVTHPAYLRIIGMGPVAVPWILRELEENGGQWFVALRAITGADPVPEEDRGDRSKMRGAWLAWARTSGWTR